MLSPVPSLQAGANLDIASALTTLLAETLVLQLCTKSCHWHVTGSNFSSLHELFDRQAGELDELADAVAERSRSLGHETLSSLSDVLAVLPDAATARPAIREAEGMLIALHQANGILARRIRVVRDAAEGDDDIVTTSLTDGWLAEAERRMWMLSASRAGGYV